MVEPIWKPHTTVAAICEVVQCVEDFINSPGFPLQVNSQIFA